jgi:hypothetical protein
MDANNVLERFQANLNYEISHQTDVHSATFIIAQVAKGNAGNEDLIELRGYYKGLKVAREILERIIAEESEEEE